MADIRKVKCVLNGGLEKEVVADKSKGKRRLKRERKSEQASSCSYKQPKDSQHVIPEECTSEIYEKTENLPFDGEEIYTSLLKSMHAIVPVDNQYKAFLMQDYNMCKKMLKASKLKMKQITHMTSKGQIETVDFERQSPDFYNGLKTRGVVMTRTGLTDFQMERQIDRQVFNIVPSRTLLHGQSKVKIKLGERKNAIGEIEGCQITVTFKISREIDKAII
ncbi:uncharacterized protein LOC134693106 [Mytilus trossulus]|uniref:uncharacterized protein LOC134693106 n=1 Tax=Mytilus trossulus TaxID=6551 RepID=UPI0030051617